MRLHIWSNAGHRTQDTFALSCTSVGARRAALLGTLSRVSSAEEWYFTVPDDDAELLAEFRRHGVRPGGRMHVSVVPDEQESANDDGRTRRLSFVGSIQAEPDLAERIDKYLKGFGRG